ncbi:MAG: hypothetical protein CML16_18670 [Pusillimonas sp.]|jgi:redox-sensitive bicupin YhaK (pirin superfamily)|nr:hypothetical protein [Pusillimonas sp.]MBC43063.1 hypothetical protein [Pusillimonas sp.]HCN70274.1 hypothetical protein [Pusillimonas sp.]HCP79083.1 hypothetical protein [Pusillimonas sp.]|tara:strand:- start:238520 stop:239401 length:882 start_codon:yes stop_codon:yes gene_type:complete
MSQPTPADPTAETVTRSRNVERLVAGQPTSDGAGVSLTRVITQPLQRRLDPYLMLDAFGSDNPDDYIAGFPNHPHRGFETITYMIAGRMRHNDSRGNEGILQNGGVQWMTAGRGLIHSELPEQEEGVMEGFQLWLNLPANEKMGEPAYKDIQSDAIPEIQPGNSVKARIIAGASHGVSGPVQHPVTQPRYLDVHFSGPGVFRQSLSPEHNVFLFVYRGAVSVNGKPVPLKHMAILENDPQTDGIIIETDVAAKLILISGQPLKEPIAQYGPFVMNTQQEIIQAVTDFQEGRLS